MDCIQLMIDENAHIKRLIRVMRNACWRLYNHESVDLEDFETMIDFLRVYNEAHHHGKEERILYKRILEETGELGERLVKHGLMTEHAQGRVYIRELELAIKCVRAGEKEAILDVIANAISYGRLFDDHIETEDNMAYAFAQEELKETSIDEINRECEQFEEEQEKEHIQETYIELLQKLEEKYLGEVEE